MSHIHQKGMLVTTIQINIHKMLPSHLKNYICGGCILPYCSVFMLKLLLPLKNLAYFQKMCTWVVMVTGVFKLDWNITP